MNFFFFGKNVTFSAVVRAEQHRTNFLDDSRNVNLPLLPISRATAIPLELDSLQLRRKQTHTEDCNNSNADQSRQFPNQQILTYRLGGKLLFRS